MPRPRPQPDPTAGRFVYRPVLTRVLVAALAGIGAWWAVDLALRGRPASAVLLALWTTAVIAALSCLFWRPAVIVDDAAVELRNVVRDVRVPWSELEDVTTRYALTLHAGGRRHQSWAGAAPGRSSVSRRLPDRRWNPGEVVPAASSRDLHADSGATAFLVEQRWRAWRERHLAGSGPGADGDAPAGVEVRWAPLLPAVAVGAAALATVLAPVLR